MVLIIMRLLNERNGSMKKLFENVGDNTFKISQENRYAKHNPEGPEFGSGVSGVWNNTTKVDSLKKSLMNALDAGNFDIVHKIVDQLANYHN